MYYRLYASKNNTIFRHLTATEPYAEQKWSVTANTGENTIMELLDGRGQSRLLFGFELPEWLKKKLSDNEFKCGLRLYDAGTIYEPTLSMKEVKLEHFTNDFAEGKGWSFQKGRELKGVSNWEFRLDGTPWTDTTFNPVATYHLNSNNEDLSFDLTTLFGQWKTDFSTPINFSLSVSNHEPSPYLAGKFIYSRHTRTVFQPFIEFFISDEIQDKLFDAVAGSPNRIYFINENGTDFSGSVTTKITLNDATVENVAATKEKDGVYYVELSPKEPGLISKKEYCTIIWAIGGKDVYKQLVLVKPQNQFVFETDYKNLFFYPATPYTHNVVRQGDIIPFEVVSQIRGAGDVVLNSYEYRILSADGFELTPWTPVSVYRNRMFFNVDTSYFYPELTYEVFIRNRRSEWSITSNTTHKFKLTTNAQSHVRELSASPYFNRDLPFSK